MPVLKALQVLSALALGVGAAVLTGEGFLAVSLWLERRGSSPALLRVGRVASSLSSRWLPALGLGAGVLGAVLARDPLVSPAYLLVGVGLVHYLEEVLKARRADHLRREAEDFILNFRRVFGGEGRFSVSLAMRQACEGLRGDLRPVVEQALRHLEVGVRLEEVLDELRKAVPDPYFRRLLTILRESAPSNREATLYALDALVEDVFRRQKVRRTALVSTAILRYTVRALQVANLVGFVLALAFPIWREYFLSSFGGRMKYLALLALALAFSLDFDQEVARRQTGIS